MRVTGQYERFSLHILIDSGSTHNFLDIAMAKKIGCKIESIQSQTIAVADGNQLQCQYVRDLNGNCIMHILWGICF